MEISPDDLRDKALLALEEALQDLRYGQARRSFAIRFALAYLWACRRGRRAPFDDFWRALASRTPWRFGDADQALAGIYEAVGVNRDEAVTWMLWRRAAVRYGGDPQRGEAGPGAPRSPVAGVPRGTPTERRSGQ